MARALRIEYEGALYHVTSRGNGYQAIYSDEQDRLSFLERLKENSERYGTIIYAYVLMDNHFHLLIETPNANLSKSMQTFNTDYTTYFNRRHNRVGHLYQGRYKAILVDKDSYLLQLSRYIHLNPVRAKVVQSPEEYLWSSYREYIGFNTKISLVKAEDILSQFGRRKKEASLRYQVFVKEGLGQELSNPLKDIVASTFLGTQEFVQSLLDKIGDLKEHRAIPSTRMLVRRMKIEEIVRKVGSIYGVSEGKIRTRRGRDNLARIVSIFFAHHFTGATNRQIGEYFGKISESAVTESVRRIEKRKAEDMLFKKRLEEIKEILITE